MQLVYFSSSEPAPKNAQNRFMHSQKHQGIPLITPLSLRRGVGGEAVRGCVSGCSFPIPSSQVQRGISLIDLPLPSERVGGEAASGVFQAVFILPLPSERVGERLLRASVQATFLCTIREESVHIAPRSPPINEKRGRASLRDLHRNLVSNYYKIVISKVGFLSIQATSLSRQSLSLQQRERCCASAESLNSLGIVHHIIDT